MEFMKFTLSDFQVEAIQGVEDQNDVVVSTNTGNGKTLIADYIIHKDLESFHEAIYTAPMKAISNQKFRQFTKTYGESNIGLITGDRVINDNAPVAIMTTEILANMIFEDPQRLRNISHVVLDEMHFLNDEDRGVIWEEIPIFLPDHINILGLSASIENVHEISEWLKRIRNKKVKEVVYPHRIIPLKHYYFDRRLGGCKKEDLTNQPISFFFKDTTTHLDLVKYLSKNHLMPALGFVFSRAQTEQKAQEAAELFDFLNNSEKQQVQEILESYQENYPSLNDTKSWQSILNILPKGICFHHAGLLPIIKEVVEDILQHDLIKLLYATDTMGMGINYSFRTAFFVSHRKFDGKQFRNINGTEYNQNAGRAGRRGIDEFGHVYSLLDTNNKDFDPQELMDLDNIQNEPIESKFKVTYDRVASLYSKFTKEQINEFFKKSFAEFQYNLKLPDRTIALEDAQMKYQKLINSRKKSCHFFNTDRCPSIQKEMHFQLRKLIKKSQRSNISNIEKNKLFDQIEKINKWFDRAPKSVRCRKREWDKCSSHYFRLGPMEENINSLKALVNNRPYDTFNRNYNKMVKMLKKINYINDEGLTPRGEVCSKIHSQVLLITELIFDNMFNEYDEDTINAIMAGIVFENENLDDSRFKTIIDYSKVYKSLDYIDSMEKSFGIEPSCNFIEAVCPTIYSWSHGCELNEIISNHPQLSEGDFVALCRGILRLYREIKHAIKEDEGLVYKINRCSEKLYRDVVAMGL